VALGRRGGNDPGRFRNISRLEYVHQNRGRSANRVWP
jgi:hypothetical protein